MCFVKYKIRRIINVIQNAVMLRVIVSVKTTFFAVLPNNLVTIALKAKDFVHQHPKIGIQPPIAMNINTTIAGKHTLHFLESRTIPLNSFFGCSKIVFVVIELLARIVQHITVDKIYTASGKCPQKLQIVTVIDADFSITVVFGNVVINLCHR